MLNSHINQHFPDILVVPNLQRWCSCCQQSPANFLVFPAESNPQSIILPFEVLFSLLLFRQSVGLAIVPKWLSCFLLCLLFLGERSWSKWRIFRINVHAVLCTLTTLAPGTSSPALTSCTHTLSPFVFSSHL